MSTAADWLGLLQATDAPALPAAWIMRTGLTLGWTLALALLGTVLAGSWPLSVRRALAAALAFWTLLPGPLSPDYWLGLAFHAPSLSAMLLCLWLLKRRLFPADVQAAPVLPPRSSLALPVVAVLLGYVLLLDAFAVLPLQIYRWGFSPALLLVLLTLALLPWVLGRRLSGGWLAPLALLLFALTRLPTGNVWDALLDPWLWLLLQIALVHAGLRRFRALPSPAATRG